MRIFSVDVKPMGKGRPRFANGHAYTPEATRNYEGLLRTKYKSVYGAISPAVGPLSMTIVAEFARPKTGQKGDWCEKRPDADNIAKAVLDALNGIAYADDAQVVDLRVTKQWADKNKVTVRIEPI